MTDSYIMSLLLLYCIHRRVYLAGVVLSIHLLSPSHPVTAVVHMLVYEVILDEKESLFNHIPLLYLLASEMDL